MPVKMMAPNTLLLWIDEDGLTTPGTPDVKDINEALAADISDNPVARNLSPAVVAGYTLNPSESDRQSSQAITDTGVGETRGAANYEGLIDFFWEDDPTVNSNSEYLEAHKLFINKGRSGYWIRRLGKLYTVPLEEGDVVDIFYFQSWTPRVTEQPNGGEIRFTVPYLPKGFVRTNIELIDTSI